MTWKQLCFSFKGRINRSIYWWYAGASLILFFFIGAIAMDLPGDGMIVLLLPILLIMYMGLAITVKRLHDTNRSGWYSLLVLSTWTKLNLYFSPQLFGPQSVTSVV